MKRMHKANVIKLNSSFLCMEIIEAAYSAAFAKMITAKNSLHGNNRSSVLCCFCKNDYCKKFQFITVTYSTVVELQHPRLIFCMENCSFFTAVDFSAAILI